MEKKNGFLLSQGAEQEIFILFDAIDSITWSDDDADGKPVIVKVRSGTEYYFYDTEFYGLINEFNIIDKVKR